MIKKVVIYIILITFAIVSCFPLFWMVLTSLSPKYMIDQGGFKFSEWRPTFSNFEALFKVSKIGRWFLNSLIIGFCVTLSHLFLDSLAGYAFAKKEFPGKTVLFWSIIATMMIPGQVIIVPLYMLIIRLRLIDSILAVILPSLSGPFGIFMMRQYIQTIPRDLEDQARIDGCSEFGIYLRVILPLAGPALAVLGIFTFITYWNAFLWPLIVLNTSTHYTLPVGLATLQEKHILDYGLVMAGASISAIPMMAVFFALQRFFIRGVRMGALKG